MTGGCSHLDSIQFWSCPNHRWLRECLASGDAVGSACHVPVVRAHWLLRRLTQQTRIRPRPRHRTPRHPLRRAWRELELLLRRRHHLRCQPMMCRPRGHRMRRRMSSRKRSASHRPGAASGPTRSFTGARRVIRTEKTVSSHAKLRSTPCPRSTSIRRPPRRPSSFHRGESGLAPGPDPERRSYFTYASFSDPDGNGWLLQEVNERLPGREWDGLTTNFRFGPHQQVVDEARGLTTPN